MSARFIKRESIGPITRFTLNRADKRNALNRDLLEELTAAVRDVAEDPSVRLLVLAADGPVFCAGMDLKQMEERAQSENAEAEWAADTQIYRDLLVELLTLRIPTLAVLQGPVLAGGVGIVLAFDMVLASTTSYFSLPEPKRGITAAVVTPLVVYRAGFGNASYLLLSGEAVPANDALRMGMIHQLVEPAELEEREQSLCASILTGAPLALEVTKASLGMCAGTKERPFSELVAQLDAGMAASAKARESTDAREGLAAFLEKRTPNWQPASD